MPTRRLAPRTDLSLSNRERSTRQSGLDAYRRVCPGPLLSTQQTVTYVSQATVRLSHESRLSAGTVEHKVENPDPRESFMVVLDCSNTRYALPGVHGKTPLFSRWALMGSVKVEFPGLVSRLLNVAVRGRVSKST